MSQNKPLLAQFTTGSYKFLNPEKICLCLPVVHGGECRIIGFGSGIEGMANVEQAGFNKDIVK